MIDEKLLGELSQPGDSRERLTVLIEWTKRPAALDRALTSRRELQKELVREYGEIKRAFLARIAREGEITVEDLPGSSKAIATATRAKWNQFVLDVALERDPSVRLLHNQRFEAV